MDTHRLVRVEWNDASDPASNQSWYSAEEVDAFADKVCGVVSIGWVRSDTKQYLTLVADYIMLDDGTLIYGRPTKIPRETITKIEDLNPT